MSHQRSFNSQGFTEAGGTWLLVVLQHKFAGHPVAGDCHRDFPDHLDEINGVVLLCVVEEERVLAVVLFDIIPQNGNLQRDTSGVLIPWAWGSPGFEWFLAPPLFIWDC